MKACGHVARCTSETPAEQSTFEIMGLFVNVHLYDLPARADNRCSHSHTHSSCQAVCVRYVLRTRPRLTRFSNTSAAIVPCSKTPRMSASWHCNAKLMAITCSLAHALCMLLRVSIFQMVHIGGAIRATRQRRACQTAPIIYRKRARHCS